MHTLRCCLHTLQRVCVKCVTQTFFQAGGVGVGGRGAALHDGTALLPGQQHLLRVHGAPDTEDRDAVKTQCGGLCTLCNVLFPKESLKVC